MPKGVMRMDEENGGYLHEKTKRVQWEPTWKDVIFYSFLGILFIGQVVLCFLFYNWANLDVLLYIGWTVFAFSMVLGMLPRMAFQAKGRAPEGESWIRTTVLVDSGIYAIVRHPMYLSFILLLISLILISQHWLSLIFSIPSVIYFYLSMVREERSSIDKFGDEYRSYMQRVPRMNLILGIVRLLRQRKNQQG